MQRGCRAIETEREREILVLIVCVITGNADNFSYACVRDSGFSYQTEVEIQFFYLSFDADAYFKLQSVECQDGWQITYSTLF